MGTIGIEWVQKYNGLQGNLSNTKAQAEGFYNTLSATRQFDWGDDLAWTRTSRNPERVHRLPARTLVIA